VDKIYLGKQLRENMVKTEVILTINSIMIWVAIGALSVLLYFTLTDSNVNSSFGQNQYFIIGFIVLLLLFRYISKIKLGDWLEIEFLDKAEKQMNKTKTTLNAFKTTVANTPGIAAATITTVDSDIEAAKLELDKVKLIIQTMKRYPR
jgi:hypothetical protein